MDFLHRHLLVSAALVLGMVIAAPVAHADQVLSPPDGKSWGESNSAETLLNMNRDPEVVRKVDSEEAPIGMKGSCTDDQGHTYTGDDEEYALCMNQKAAKRKAQAQTEAAQQAHKASQ